ncbi:alpha/beta fold hydrolase [Klebsiella oxytoca]|uniref:Alpha/beta fold hydrolase n=1 Tax=Klebsiella oxytoca TaxID=571 RepID=A0A6B8MSH7_KLEOX|nr:alpha/beta hydrolase [Klebsiella oxytoca]QGN37284.1 alpha/beta fold hydrolase [Klebsiella oxytoca]
MKLKATLFTTMLFASVSSTYAEYDPNLKSIDTPPAVSQQKFDLVKSEKLGQYAYSQGLESKFIETDGVRLHYVEGGNSGTPIIFIHGFGSTWKMWEPVMEKFKATHKVIAIDLPGLGQSSPIKNEDYSAQNVSTILLSAIKKIAGDEPIYFVTHDLGNSASYPLVANNQGYIKKVVFMDSPIPDKSMFEYAGYTPSGPGLGWHFGYFSFGDIAEKQIASDPSLFFSYFIKTYAGKKDIFTPQLLSELIEPYSTREKLHAAFGYYKSHAKSIAQNEQLLAEGKKLSIPSMALTGEKGVNDVLVKEMRSRFVQDPQNFKGVILPDTGHWMVEENPTAVSDELSQFLFN